MLYSTERHFRLWDYTVSHDQLLLRSPGTPESPKNLDVIFLGVDYLSIPTMLTGLKLGRASVKDSAKVIGRLKEAPDCCEVYAVVTGGHRYYIVAVAFRVYENDLDLFESSLEYFTNDNRGHQAGKLIVHSGATRQTH